MLNYIKIAITYVLIFSKLIFIPTIIFKILNEKLKKLVTYLGSVFNHTPLDKSNKSDKSESQKLTLALYKNAFFFCILASSGEASFVSHYI